MSVNVQEEWVPGPHGISFYTSVYSPPTKPIATILFLHGFADYFGRYGESLKLIAEKGFTVVAFDQRGWGKTFFDKDHNKGKSVYGQTTTALQMEDVDFMVGWAKEKFSAPLYLMGHSMGGMESLAYPTRQPPQVNLSRIAGVIACSPLIQQASPAPKWQRVIGGFVLNLHVGFIQWFKIPSTVNPKDLSRDPKVGEEYMKDPLVILSGTMKGISDMLNLGDSLHKSDYKNWPPELPLFLAHGDADNATSYPASAEFFKDVYAKDKTISTLQGGYHELLHEPDGTKEKLIGEIAEWVTAQVGHGSHPPPATAAATSPGAPLGAENGVTASKL